MEQKKITMFRGNHGFLSNFFEVSIWVGGIRYKSVEHAYQAHKSSNVSTRKLIAEAATPMIAKTLGKSIQLQSDWEAKRVPTMKQLLDVKFENPILSTMLIATSDLELVNDNNYNDRFWGVCRGSGQNILGKLLMQIREELSCQNRV